MLVIHPISRPTSSVAYNRRVHHTKQHWLIGILGEHEVQACLKISRKEKKSLHEIFTKEQQNYFELLKGGGIQNRNYVNL